MSEALYEALPGSSSVFSNPMSLDQNPVLRNHRAPAAIVALCVGDRRVDAVLESLEGSPASRIRWFVVGHDLMLLASLEALWGHLIDLTIVGVPEGSLQDAEPVVAILENEMNGPIDECVWLVTSSGPQLPQEASRVLNLDTIALQALPLEIARLVSDPLNPGD